MKSALEEVFGQQKNHKDTISKIRKDLDEEKERGASRLSKYGFVRFNPFDRVGGEQSYCLAILDERNNGIVLTFLFMREGMRVYMKSVIDGKGQVSELSQEEKKAVVKAGVM